MSLVLHQIHVFSVKRWKKYVCRRNFLFDVSLLYLGSDFFLSLESYKKNKHDQCTWTLRWHTFNIFLLFFISFSIVMALQKCLYKLTKFIQNRDGKNNQNDSGNLNVNAAIAHQSWTIDECSDTLQRLLSNFIACDSDLSCQIKISIYIIFFLSLQNH